MKVKFSTYTAAKENPIQTTLYLRMVLLQRFCQVFADEFNCELQKHHMDHLYGFSDFLLRNAASSSTSSIYSFNPCLKGFASSNFQSSFVLREFAKVLSLVVVRVSTKEKESPTTEYHSVVVVVVGKFYSMVCSVHVYNKAFASVHTST